MINLADVGTINLLLVPVLWKNIFDFTPPKNSIARAFDPFDKQVIFDNSGNAIQNENNPYALTFDPSYVFASNQGFRFFFGLRYKIP